MCKNLYRGTMAICPMVCYSKYYDAYHETDIMEKLCKNGTFSIYEVKDFQELKDKLDSPCELCNYCTLYRARQDEELQEKWRRKNDNK